MKMGQSHGRRAFTLVEGVVVVAVVAVLSVVFLPGLMRAKTRSRIHCVGNLKEVGIAFRIWEGDNGDKYPMQVPVALGGARELIATGNVAGCFQVMSNEVSAPKILTCPEDARHKATTNWAGLNRLDMSYFIGSDVAETDPQGVLSGDANLVQNGRVVAAGRVDLGSNSVSWTRDRHQRMGNILMTDGSVQTVGRIAFTNWNGVACFPTNTVVVP
jgi:prepilin-type processing-associated H-X9-DG protein